eukprot:UN08871
MNKVIIIHNYNNINNITIDDNTIVMNKNKQMIINNNIPINHPEYANLLLQQQQQRQHQQQIQNNNNKSTTNN